MKGKYILGIDTGGTYTDGVLINTDNNRIVKKAKALTTRTELSIGINNCIRNLRIDEYISQISLVCLSTTLATNTAVEGKLSRVGLIAMSRYEMDEVPETACFAEVKGEMNLEGKVVEEIDENEIEQATLSMKGKIDSLVISGYYSVRNPMHEIKCKEIARRYLDVPIICAHELTRSLGFYERCDTAVLNAHLLPVTKELICKMKTILREIGITAEITMIKGDGSLMRESVIMDRPIETVLSGPAASIVGGAFLTDKRDALIVDIGGTTTDIAMMKDGRVVTDQEGAIVGNWHTKVTAASIKTTGLGGDSRLVLKGGRFKFGPMKAIPVSYAAVKYPHLKKEYVTESRLKQKLFLGFAPYEGLELVRLKPEVFLTETHKAVLKMLADGPHTVAYICSRLKARQIVGGIDSLITHGIVNIISITPTDLLHISGECSIWDEEAAKLALDIAARMSGKGRNEAVILLKNEFICQLGYAVFEAASYFDGHSLEADDDWLFNMMFHYGRGTGLMCRLNKEIVGLGAPAKIWLKALEEKLDCKVHIPLHHEVANAVGTAMAESVHRFEALIEAGENSGYNVHTQWQTAHYPYYEDARTYAISILSEKADVYISSSEIEEWKRSLDENTIYSSGTDEAVVYENTITLTLSSESRYIKSK